MKILHTSFECYPIAKVGGLADVVGSLPKYQNDLGYDSNVIMPYYDNTFFKKRKFRLYVWGEVRSDNKCSIYHNNRKQAWNIK